MIACQYFVVLSFVFTVANKVLDDVNKPLLTEHAFKKHIIIHHLRTLVHTVFRFPLHIAVFARCDSAGLRLCHVAHHTEHIVSEQCCNLLHVVF